MARVPFGPCVSALFVSLLAVSSALARPQTNQVTSSDPQALAFAVKSVAVLTGGEPIADVTLTGTATRTAASDIETGTVTLKALGTASSLIDFSGSEGNRVEVRNSSGGIPQGSWVGTDGVSHPMASSNCVTDAVWFFPALSVLSEVSTANSNLVATYAGQESLDGETVDHVRFWQVFPTGSGSAGTLALLQHLSTVDVYLDATSLLPVELDFNIHPDDNAGADIPVEIQYGDYQRLGGVLVPTQVRKFINHTLFLDLKLTEAAVNTNLSPADFDVTTAGQ